MTAVSDRPFAIFGLGVAILLAMVFAFLVAQYGRELRQEIREKMIERDAAVLYPVAQRQIQRDGTARLGEETSGFSLSALLPDARREGLLAMAIFDEDGVTLEQVPLNQLLVELPVEDFLRLQNSRPITRFHPQFQLSDLFPGTPTTAVVPVLEIILPLRASKAAARTGAEEPRLVGFVRYHLDARVLDRELAILDDSVRRKGTLALSLGLASIAVIVGGAYVGLKRAQRTIAERNERILRTNFELTLAVKASALGQITLNLIHGLQGPVAGLKDVVNRRDAQDGHPADWETAATYTNRMQEMIEGTVALLSDVSNQVSYELTGHELMDTVRTGNLTAAQKKGVTLSVSGGFDATIDNHRGGILCLITSNLVQNAIQATDQGLSVGVILRNGGKMATVTVSDEGCGIPDELRAHLFEPGRSGRPRGTGLGLAISQLLARQIGATLVLESTGTAGTVFRLSLPIER
jgi:signal transduction histidine kinase